MSIPLHEVQTVDQLTTKITSDFSELGLPGDYEFKCQEVFPTLLQTKKVWATSGALTGKTFRMHFVQDSGDGAVYMRTVAFDGTFTDASEGLTTLPDNFKTESFSVLIPAAVRQHPLEGDEVFQTLGSHMAGLNRMLDWPLLEEIQAEALGFEMFRQLLWEGTLPTKRFLVGASHFP